MKKVCNRCKQAKNPEDFHKYARNPDGRKNSCKSCLNKAGKKYFQENKDKVLKNAKQYQASHAQEIKEKHRIYYQKRRKIDLIFRFVHNLKNRIRNAFNKKSTKSMFLIGCTAQELKIYLESKFSPGMTWENYGLKGWHIDHIRPCSSFDLLDPNEQIKCFHYTNLQPLWAKENLKKSNKF